MAQRMGIESEGHHITIEFATDKSVRMRKVVSRSNLRVTGKYPGRKAKRMMRWESKLELLAFKLHDVASYVKRFQEQPARITFFLNDEKRVHVPDLLVEIHHGYIFREIKTDEEANSPEILERTRYLSEVLPAYGYQYDILTESEIKKQPRLDNAEFLLRHARKKVGLLEWEAFRKRYVPEGGVWWKNVLSNQCEVLDIFQICTLILDSYLLIDIENLGDSDAVMQFNPTYLG